MPKRFSYLSPLSITKPIVPAKPLKPKRPLKARQGCQAQGGLKGQCSVFSLIDKLEQGMSIRDKSVPLIGRPVVGGRPRKKRTKEIETKLLAAVAAGAPYTLAAASVGICMDTFIDWRRQDPVFAAEVERVAAQGALKRLKKIEAHGKENFSALAWMLERRYPQEFSRPEVQLNVNTQLNTAAILNGVDFQTVVVRDLEYLGLKEQSAYTHHPGTKGPVREIEAVSEELAGHLTRGGSNGMVISQSAAEAHQRRLAAIRSKFAHLLEQTPGEH